MNRMLPRLAAVALLAAPALTTPGNRALAAAVPKSDSVVKAAAVVKPAADGKQEITLTLDIDKPWHLYANPVGSDDLTSVQTVVTVAKVDPKDVKIVYPEGKKVKDSVLGTYSVYEEKAVIVLTVNRAKDDAGPIELSVKIQACDKTCLLPATLKVTAAP